MRRQGGEAERGSDGAGKNGGKKDEDKSKGKERIRDGGMGGREEVIGRQEVKDGEKYVSQGGRKQGS